MTFGWAELEITAVLVAMAAVPIGIVTYIVWQVRRIRAQQDETAKRLSALESDLRRRER